MPFIDEGTLERIAAAARQTAGSMEHGDSTMRRAVDVLEVGGAAGALSYLDARYGDNGQMSFIGVPVDLWVALAGLGLSWFGWAGPHNRFARDSEMLGAGGLAAYLSRLGTSWGAAQRLAAGTPATAQAHGQGGPELVGGLASMLGIGRAPAHVGADGRTYVVTEMARQAA